MRLNESPRPVQAMYGTSPAPAVGGVPAIPAKPCKLIRLPHVEERCGLRKSTIYAGVKDKTFPAPVRLSARAVAWREADIDRWIAERVTTGEAS